MNIHSSSLNYERGVLTATARAYLANPSLDAERELERVVKNTLNAHGTELTQWQLIALVIGVCNEGWAWDLKDIGLVSRHEGGGRTCKKVVVA